MNSRDSASPVMTGFLGLLSVTLLLIPLGAHLLELPAKMGLGRADYRTVQQLYRGWAWSGVVVVVALASTATLGVRLRARRREWWPAALAFAGVALSQVVFWTFTFPVNTRTENWTRLPDDWETLRARWEYSHAIAAVLVLGAAVSLFVLVLRGPGSPLTDGR
jgi:hypothetical protein